MIFVIMRSPKMLTPNEYDVFFSFLENTVMKKRILTVKTAPSVLPGAVLRQQYLCRTVIDGGRSHASLHSLVNSSMAASSSGPSAAMVTVSPHFTARPITAKSIFFMSATLPFFSHSDFALKAFGSFAQDTGGTGVQTFFVLNGDIDALHKKISPFWNRYCKCSST